MCSSFLRQICNIIITRGISTSKFESYNLFKIVKKVSTKKTEVGKQTKRRYQQIDKVIKIVPTIICSVFNFSIISIYLFIPWNITTSKILTSFNDTSAKQ